jgi:hypothetical protein
VARRRRYQFFVSSTLRDLVDERRAILEVLLRRNHMPIGMELFAAAGNSAWPLIEHVLRGSDYYLLIMGGRYGSRDRSGLSYTEREYRFARTIGKPVIALLHTRPEKLARRNGEGSAASWRKLQRFRRHVEDSGHCGYWDASGELPDVFDAVFASVRRAEPAHGWVRATRRR